MSSEAELMLSEEDRQKCEIWTRVMGYHRPVESFNIGKKGEHAERKHFLESKCGSLNTDSGVYSGTVVDVVGDKVYQHTGRGNLAAHDLSRFDQGAPGLGENLSIQYVKGATVVREADKSQGKAVAVSR